jgi:pimeloyl-ACP methyl ester carboxylesterase
VNWRENYAEWVDLIADLAIGAPPPAFTYGMSLGGITAFRAAQKAGAIAGVVATTLVDLRDPEVFARMTRTPLLARAALLGFSVPWLFDRVALPLAMTAPLETLTTDEELAQLILRDPRLGRRRVPARLFRSMVQYQPPRDDYALACPLLLVHPGADLWTPTALSRPVFDAVSGAKYFRELSNGAHAPLEDPAYRELNTTVREFLAARISVHSR